MRMRDVVRKTLAVLKKQGHCKGTLQDADGRVCLLGARHLAVNGGSHLWGDMSQVNKFVSLLGFSSELALVDWNNAPERTQKDVENLLRKHAR